MTRPDRAIAILIPIIDIISLINVVHQAVRVEVPSTVLLSILESLGPRTWRCRDSHHSKPTWPYGSVVVGVLLRAWTM